MVIEDKNIAKLIVDAILNCDNILLIPAFARLEAEELNKFNREIFTLAERPRESFEGFTIENSANLIESAKQALALEILYGQTNTPS